ncbi:Uncharacterized protein TCM_029536 [Theobroma cacao]|uniref:Uncharacterized protein n=1 Tax=Theobroma cacao TaxID=3641 RepID=A0A061GDY1_THECC|nr:Uncharacterized protein TCM_029536 [Theobroma cacao]
MLFHFPCLVVKQVGGIASRPSSVFISSLSWSSSSLSTVGLPLAFTRGSAPLSQSLSPVFPSLSAVHSGVKLSLGRRKASTG